MTIPRLRKASLLIHQVNGGGAQKIVMGIAKLLDQRGLLERLYVGHEPTVGAAAPVAATSLNSSRALGAVPALWRELARDRAEAFLLTASYMALAPILRLRRPRARILIRVASIISFEMRDRKYLSRLRYYGSLALAMACSTTIVAQGEGMRRDLVATFPWARRKIVVIRNFVEDAVWTYEPQSVADYAYIFCAATFRPVKAFDTLLAAYSASPTRHRRKLVVAGVEPDHRAFSELMQRFGLADEEVIRLGFVSQPYDWIANADLCVLASRYEGFSNFLLESAAFGKRVVATSCPGGNEELLALYENSVIVPVDDVDALAQRLAERRRDISQRRARQMLSAFEWAKVREDYLKAIFPEDVAT